MDKPVDIAVERSVERHVKSRTSNPLIFFKFRKWYPASKMVPGRQTSREPERSFRTEAHTSSLGSLAETAMRRVDGEAVLVSD